MKKNKILLPLLALALSTGLLSGCGATGLTSGLIPGQSSSNDTTSSVPSSTSSTPTSSPSSSETSMVVGPFTIPAARDLTLPAKTYDPVSLSDEELAKFLSDLGAGPEVLASMSAEMVSSIKKVLSTASLKASQLSKISAMLPLLFALKRAETYTMAKKALSEVYSGIKDLMASVEADQLAKLVTLSFRDLQGLIPTSIGEKESSSIYSMVGSLAEVNKILAFFSENQGVVSQYSLYKEYYENSEAYQAPVSNTPFLSEQEGLLLFRGFYALVDELFKAFSEDELSTLILGLTPLGKKSAYAEEAQAGLGSLLASPVALINRIGQLLLDLNFTEKSWDLFRTSVVDLLFLVENAISTNLGSLASGDTRNASAIARTVSVIQGLAAKFPGKDFAVILRLAGYVLGSVDQSNYNAIMAYLSDKTNPVANLSVLLNKALGYLSLPEQATLSALFTTLGLTYSEFLKDVEGWTTLDFTDNGTGKATVMDYFAAVGQKIVSTLLPDRSAFKTTYSVYCETEFVAKNYTFSSDDFYLMSHSEKEETLDRPTLSISDIVADTSKLGYSAGTFKVTDSTTNTVDNWVFAYQVVPTLKEFTSFSIDGSGAKTWDDVLYLPKGMDVADSLEKNVVSGSADFNDENGNSFSVMLSDPGVSFAVDTSVVGETYGLLTYTESETSKIYYGVVPTEVYEESEIVLAQGNLPLAYVPVNGDILITIRSGLARGEDFVEFSYYEAHLSELGLSSAAPGVFHQNVTLDDQSVAITYTVLAVGEYTIRAFYSTTMETVYPIGATKIIVHQLNLAFGYQRENETSTMTGFVIFWEPEVETVLFDTSLPDSENSLARTGVFGFQGIQHTFDFTVTRPQTA